MGYKQERITLSNFANSSEDFVEYTGKLIQSDQIQNIDYSGLNVVIIGANQYTVQHLEFICQTANSVQVYQITPKFILPKTEKGMSRLINHPLLIKNRRLFNTRIKTLLALRFLESQVVDAWLRRQLTPNMAQLPKQFLKSDSYFAALQRDNCNLITWPINKISGQFIHSVDGYSNNPDLIITTY